MKHPYNIYFTSDWHIGHDAVITFSNRPFKDCDHMHRVLINNYNASVKDSDTVYFLGDMGLCKSSIISDVLSQLNGTKILILGNHDKGRYAMKRMGFDAVLNSASLVVSKELVTMSHCPLQHIQREDISNMRGAVDGESWHGELRHAAHFSLPNRGQFHLHGHIHSPNHGRSKRILGRQLDVGVDANQYRPLSLSEIESWIQTTKNKQLKT